jgi:hypothetical protein
VSVSCLRVVAAPPCPRPHLLSAFALTRAVPTPGHRRAKRYVEFLAEYAPYDLYALDNIGRAVHMFPHMTGMIKLDQDGRIYWGTKAMGAGIQNILWADPRTVTDVSETTSWLKWCVLQCR